MIQCQQCGQGNSEQSQFCRFCGTRMETAGRAPQNDYNYEAPRPYSWKTDEFQTQSEPRVKPAMAQAPAFSPQQHSGFQPLVYSGQQHLAQNYRCPNCGTNALPVIERRISTAGWVVFSLLLVFTFVFFWIGLLMKENVSVCPVCRAKLS